MILITILALLIFVVAGGIFFFSRRALRYLQIFQQEDYNGKRFLQWIISKRAWDRKGSLTALSALFAVLLAQCFFGSLRDLIFIPFLMIAASLALIIIARREDDPCTTGKITLKMTDRARRIYRLAVFLYVSAAVLAVLLSYVLPIIFHYPSLDLLAIIFWSLQLILIQSHPLWLVFSDWLLKPHEKKLQDDFAGQAKELITKYHPVVIGITGSYGKTSTKVLLKEMLGSAAPTFTTPRSINSYMGVTREIRERLKPGHKWAVIEMGAYQRGSIERMCTLTPPKAAIITAVGEMHLERFGTQENVYLAKSELARAVPEDGILIVNGDYELCRKMASEFKKRTTLVYGLKPESGPLDALMTDISPDSSGSHFKIHWQGQVYSGFTRLLGSPMLSNALAAFTMACTLGVHPELALAALRNVKPEANRLEPVKTSISGLCSLSSSGNGTARQGQILRLNDAFNSNPVGFASALDVLATISGGRKILVTPGMVELGARQEEENTKAARQAAGICDLVVVVGETNKQALLSGLQAGGLAADRYKDCPTMKQALTYLACEFCQNGDVVLIENDLPDLYETKMEF